MAFPSSPINNQVAIVNNISYTYNAVKTAWVRTPPSSTVVNILNANVITSLQTILANNITANGNVNIGQTANFTFNTLSANSITIGNTASFFANNVITSNNITANNITANGNFFVTGNTILTGPTNFLFGNLVANNITLANNFIANSITLTANTIVNVLANTFLIANNITANNITANGNLTVFSTADFSFNTLRANNIIATNNISLFANNFNTSNNFFANNFTVNTNFNILGTAVYGFNSITANNITMSNSFIANSFSFSANGTVVFGANNVFVANNLTANNIFANNFLTIFANNTITISSNNNIFMNASNILVSNTITANILTANQISGNVILLESTNIGNNTIGYLGAPQKNITATSYTLVLTDAGKTIYLTQGANTGTVAIPTNATVPFPLGTTILLIMGPSFSSNVTAANPPALWVASNSVQRTSVTLGSYSMSSLIKVATDTWYISGAGAY
jgi:hypothetical protein